MGVERVLGRDLRVLLGMEDGWDEGVANGLVERKRAPKKQRLRTKFSSGSSLPKAATSSRGLSGRGAAGPRAGWKWVRPSALVRIVTGMGMLRDRLPRRCRQTGGADAGLVVLADALIVSSLEVT